MRKAKDGSGLLPPNNFFDTVCKAHPCIFLHIYSAWVSEEGPVAHTRMRCLCVYVGLTAYPCIICQVNVNCAWRTVTSMTSQYSSHRFWYFFCRSLSCSGVATGSDIPYGSSLGVFSIGMMQFELRKTMFQVPFPGYEFLRITLK